MVFEKVVETEDRRSKKPKKSSPSFSFSFSNFPKLNFSLWGFKNV
tara:strand:- start:150 stop:284 length:135 start_codon:yes stop_codon:yes gene_type:complete